MVEYFAEKSVILLELSIKKNKHIKQGIIIYLVVTLIISLGLNITLYEKLVKQAYEYNDNIVELEIPIMDMISKDIIDENIEIFDTNSNGKFSGERINGKKEGNGTFVFEDGSIYTGTFDNDNINGQGILTIPGRGTYEGNFVNGKKSGQGTYKFINGDIYIGNWDNDTMSGYGTYTFSNGDSYTGQFLDNKFHGQGTYKKDGNKYTGKWINNVYQK